MTVKKLNLIYYRYLHLPTHSYPHHGQGHRGLSVKGEMPYCIYRPIPPLTMGNPRVYVHANPKLLNTEARFLKPQYSTGGFEHVFSSIF